MIMIIAILRMKEKFSQRICKEKTMQLILGLKSERKI